MHAHGGHLRRAFLAARLQLVYEMFARGGWRFESSRDPRNKLSELEEFTRAPDPLLDQRELQIASDAMAAHAAMHQQQ